MRETSPTTRGRRRGRSTARAAWVAICLMATIGSPRAVVRIQGKVYGKVRDSEAVVYFVRVAEWGKGRSEPLYVYADRQFLGVLPKNSYTFAHVPPGERLLWNGQTARWKKATDAASSLTTQLEGGQEYYFVMNFRIEPHVLFTPLTAEEGRDLIAKARYYAKADDADIEAASAGIGERYGWIEELEERRQEPEVLIRRTTDEESLELLCSLKRIEIGEIYLGNEGGMANIGYAEDFDRALRKWLPRRGFELTSGDADARLTGVVDKYRQETKHGYQYVRRATVMLTTPDGREFWRIDVDTSKPNIKENPFTAWKQLGGRVADRLHDACPARKKR